MQPQWTDPFVVYHYNGLGIKSDKSHSKKVCHCKAYANNINDDNNNCCNDNK